MFFVRPMRNRGCSTLVRSGETHVVPVFAGTMISLRIASRAREVETVELALFVRHHSNGWLVLEEAIELHRDVERPGTIPILGEVSSRQMRKLADRKKQGKCLSKGQRMLARELLALQEQEYALALAADIRAEEALRRSIEARLVHQAGKEDEEARAQRDADEDDPPPLTLEQLRAARLRVLSRETTTGKRPTPRRARRILDGIDASNIVGSSRRRRGASN